MLLSHSHFTMLYICLVSLTVALCRRWFSLARNLSVGAMRQQDGPDYVEYAANNFLGYGVSTATSQEHLSSWSALNRERFKKSARCYRKYRTDDAFTRRILVIADSKVRHCRENHLK